MRLQNRPIRFLVKGVKEIRQGYAGYNACVTDRRRPPISSRLSSQVS